MKKFPRKRKMRLVQLCQSHFSFINYKILIFFESSFLIAIIEPLTSYATGSLKILEKTVVI